MSSDDAATWDDRYQQSGSPVPAPPDALVAAGVALPSAGRALDVACGAGSVSTWLASQGLDVVGIDVSPVAIDLARSLAAAQVHDRGEPLGQASFEVVDLDLDPDLDLDLDRGFPVGQFEVVVCQRFRDPSLYPRLVAALAPGGLLVLTVLSVVGHSGDPGPFRAPRGELVEFFGPLVDVVWSHEADGQAHLVATART